MEDTILGKQHGFIGDSYGIEENITYEIYQKKKKQHLKEKVSM